jgi:hypothetical protein
MYCSVFTALSVEVHASHKQPRSCARTEFSPLDLCHAEISHGVKSEQQSAFPQMHGTPCEAREPSSKTGARIPQTCNFQHEREYRRTALHGVAWPPCTKTPFTAGKTCKCCAPPTLGCSGHCSHRQRGQCAAASAPGWTGRRRDRRWAGAAPPARPPPAPPSAARHATPPRSARIKTNGIIESP